MFLKSPVLENGTQGSMRGASGNRRSYRDARPLVAFVGCRGWRGVMDEGLVALAAGEPGESVLMPESRLVRLDGCETWETVHVALRGRWGAAVGGRIEDVSPWRSRRCGRPA